MEELLARLLDEREITQQLVNYCRSMDRCDLELGRAVFHPEATADYGAMYQGTGAGFVEFALAGHVHLDTHLHRISNVSIQVDGDTAGSECYVDTRLQLTQAGTVLEISNCGRFVDRWAKRDGRWAISDRRYLHGIDATRPVEGARYSSTGARDRSDPSYEVLGFTAAGTGAE